MNDIELLHADQRGAANDFRFVAVGKWEPRKAYDDILCAYFDAFADDSADNAVHVSLWLRSKVDQQEFEEIVDKYCEENNVSKENLPQVIRIFFFFFLVEIHF